MMDCTPNFIPAGQGSPDLGGCIMPTNNENRSRLNIGGTLFRSVDVGPDTNSIAVESIWLVCTIGGSPQCDINGNGVEPYTSHNSLSDVVAVELIVYINNIEVCRYRVPQAVIGSPIINGIKNLRAVIDTVGSPCNKYITLPMIDTQTTTGVVGPSWDAAVDDGDYLAQFPITNLTGGTGLSNNVTQTELDNIRTGPAFTLVNIGLSEIQNVDGSLSNLNQPKYWNGTEWKVFDSINVPNSCDS